MMEGNLTKAFAFVIELQFKKHREKEKDLQMLIDICDSCYDHDFPHFLIPDRIYSPGPRLTAKEMPIICGSFPSNYQIKIKDNFVQSLEEYKILLLYSGCLSTDNAFGTIKRHRGEVAINLDDTRKIDSWVDYVKYDYLKRKIGSIPRYELLESLGQYSRAGKVFLKKKTKKEDTHGIVVSVDELRGISDTVLPCRDSVWKDSTQTVEPYDNLIISEPIDIMPATQPYRRNEFRAWVVEDKLATIRRYGYPEHVIRNQVICEFVEQFINNHRAILPSYYVVDIGLSTDKGPFVVELNPIAESIGLNRDVFVQVAKLYMN